MRLMANGAAVAHRFMLENVRLRLFPMTLGTGLVQASHCQGAGRLHDVHAMRIMALRAVHFAFEHGMVLRQIELGMRFQVAGETRTRIFARVYNKAPAAPSRDVTAPGPVARFAASRARDIRSFIVQARVRAGWKLAHDSGMAIETGFVSHKCGS